MFDSKFNNMEQSSKEEKMKKIIRVKARGITEEHVDQIVNSVNLGRQYAIICTYDLPSFLKNAHEEIGESFKVDILPVYGNLTPGIVTSEGDYEEPQAEDTPSAFIKTVKITQNGKNYYEDSIFIYETA